MGFSAPVAAELERRRAMASSRALVPAINPVEYAIPGRWGGVLMNFGIDAATELMLR